MPAHPWKAADESVYDSTKVDGQSPVPIAKGCLSDRPSYPNACIVDEDAQRTRSALDLVESLVKGRAVRDVQFHAEKTIRPASTICALSLPTVPSGRHAVLEAAADQIAVHREAEHDDLEHVPRGGGDAPDGLGKKAQAFVDREKDIARDWRRGADGTLVGGDGGG